MERNDNIFDRNGRNDLHWTAMLYHDSKFWMFYNYGMAVMGPTPLMAGLATSEDGEKFDIIKDVVIHPDFGSWDSELIEVHSIIRADGMWRMYYCGRDEENFRIGMAESEDLIEWKKHKEPIVDIGDSHWESVHVADPYVLRFGGKYLMFYMGKGDVWQVGMAESKDGIEWNKHIENPMIRADQEWCDGCVTLSGAVHFGNKLLAAVHGYSLTDNKFRVKLVYSEKGYSWSPVKFATGIEPEPQDFTINPGKWCDRGLVHPEIIRIGGKLLIYYTGIRVGSPNLHRVGRVELYENEINL